MGILKGPTALLILKFDDDFITFLTGVSRHIVVG